MSGFFGVAGAALAVLTSHAGHGVLVSGAVKSPGIAPIAQTRSIFDAVKDLGGFRPDADKRRVRIVSAGGQETVVDLTKLGTIPAVRPGDRVVVPAIDPSRSVVIQGGVDHEGAFDFRPGMTVRDLLASAQASPKASLDKVKIFRADKSGTVEVHTANLMAMNLDAEALRAGDTVYVPRASASMSDRELLTIAIVGLLVIVLFK